MIKPNPGSTENTLKKQEDVKMGQRQKEMLAKLPQKYKVPLLKQLIPTLPPKKKPKVVLGEHHV